MKKTGLILTLLILASSIVFATTTSTSTNYRITAYKLKISDGIPDKVLNIKCLNSTGNAVNKNSNVVLDDSFRANSMMAFSWVFSGNIWQGVTLSISFGPMKHETESSYIYYDVTLEHTESRLDNVRLGNGAVGTVVESAKVPYQNGTYAIIYSDSVSMPGSSLVQTSAVSKTVTYNMSTNSLVYTKSSGSYSISADKSTFNTDYQNTCGYWTRYGNAKINLHVNRPSTSATSYQTYTTSTGTGAVNLVAGMYYANVTVTVTAN